MFGQGLCGLLERRLRGQLEHDLVIAVEKPKRRNLHDSCRKECPNKHTRLTQLQAQPSFRTQVTRQKEMEAINGLFANYGR